MNVDSAVGFSEQRSVDADQLVRNVGWMHRLAKSLLHDSSLAEDVVQRALLAALERPPHSPDRLQSWLSTVTRNFVKLTYREQARRRGRERRVAQPEVVSFQAPEWELDETRESVVEEVLGLPEPYRSTLVQLFYRDVSAREIARELGVPESTLRIRKSRGLALLRERLERRDREIQIRRSRATLDDRSHEHPARDARYLLVPFALPPSLWSSFVTSSAMSGASPKSTSADSSSGKVSVEVAPGGTAGSSAFRNRKSVASVLGVALLLLSALFLAWWFPTATSPLSSGPIQSAILEERSAVGGIEPPGANRSEAGVHLDRSAKPSSVSVASRRAFRVIDAETHLPISDARIDWSRASLRSEKLAHGHGAYGYLMQSLGDRSLGTTDSRGEVELPASVPSALRFQVVADGYATHVERARDRAFEEVYEIALPRTAPARIEISSRAEPGGRNVSPAQISVALEGSEGDQQVLAVDASGRVAFDWRDRHYSYTVTGPGWVPVRGLASLPTSAIEVVPGRSSLGRVVDSDGQPLPNARVRIRVGRTWRGLGLLSELSSVAEFETPPLPAEGAVQLEISHPSHMSQTFEAQLPWSEVREFRLQSGVWVEGVVRAPSGAGLGGMSATVALAPRDEFFGSPERASRVQFRRKDLPQGVTDRDGRFRVGPLPPGNYTMLVMHPRWSDQEHAIELVRESTANRFEIDLELGRSIRGRALYPDGQPASGVVLSLGPLLADEVSGIELATNDRGEFEFAGIPSRPLRNRVLNPDDVRWRALETDSGEAEGLRARGLILQVVRPHQLQGALGTPVEHIPLYGSRNTVFIPLETNWIDLRVAFPSEVPTTPPGLVDVDRKPVRTLVNLIVVSPNEPREPLITFGGMDGNPFLVPAASELGGCLVGYWTRRYSVAFHIMGREGQLRDPVVLADLRPGQGLAIAEGDPGRPSGGRSDGEGMPIFISPEVDGIEPFAAIYWGLARWTKAERGNAQSADPELLSLILAIPDLGPGRYVAYGFGDTEGRAPSAEQKLAPKKVTASVGDLRELGHFEVRAREERGPIPLQP